jgi:hypothetical protein
MVSSCVEQVLFALPDRHGRRLRFADEWTHDANGIRSHRDADALLRYRRSGIRFEDVLVELAGLPASRNEVHVRMTFTPIRPI